MKGGLEPSAELRTKVATIASYLSMYSPRAQEEVGPRLWRSYFRHELERFLKETGISVSFEFLEPWLWGLDKRGGRTLFQVADRGVVRLEFIDKVDILDGEVGRTSLETVHRYKPGDWESKVDEVYAKCVCLNNQMQQWNSLYESIGAAGEENWWSEFAQALEDMVQREPNFGLAWAYLARAYEEIGRREDAKKAAATAAKVNPDNPLTVGALLGVTEDATEMVEFVEQTKQPIQTIRLLASSPDHVALCELLYCAYLSVGRVKEALTVCETLVEMHPQEATYRLTLGNMFFGAIYNTKGIPRDSIKRFRFRIDAAPQVWAPMLETLKKENPSFYKALTDSRYESSISSEGEYILNQITLGALGCSYELARKTAEEQFVKAMQLSTDEHVREMAKSQLVALRVMDKK